MAPSWSTEDQLKLLLHCICYDDFKPSKEALESAPAHMSGGQNANGCRSVRKIRSNDFRQPRRPQICRCRIHDIVTDTFLVRSSTSSNASLRSSCLSLKTVQPPLQPHRARLKMLLLGRLRRVRQMVNARPKDLTMMMKGRRSQAKSRRRLQRETTSLLSRRVAKKMGCESHSNVR